MRYTQHKSNNDVIGAPKGWDQKALPCGALPITRVQIDGMPAILSFWEPGPEEREALLQGGRVMLTVFGEFHPPVSINVNK